MMWNNILYIEGGGYTSLARNVQQTVGTFDAAQNKIDGGAPYWRVALQHNWHGHYGAIGSFGMQANVNPQRLQGAGTDQFTDFGFDATYQYLVNPRHIFELNGTYIRENRNMNASVALGFAEKQSSSLNTVRIRSAYTFLQTYGLTLAYGQTSGTAGQANRITRHLPLRLAISHSVNPHQLIPRLPTCGLHSNTSTTFNLTVVFAITMALGAMRPVTTRFI